MYTNLAHCLICLVIIHSNFNDPPQHPQLNDYSFIYFQLSTGTLFFRYLLLSPYLALLGEVRERQVGY